MARPIRVRRMLRPPQKFAACSQACEVFEAVLGAMKMLCEGISLQLTKVGGIFSGGFV